MEELKCPKCNSSEIKRAASKTLLLEPMDKMFALGSKLYANVCTECGAVFDFTVDFPEEFK